MCGDPDYCYVSENSAQHRARKEHVCCACREPISAGHYYVRSFLITDRSNAGERAENYKHCLRCWAMLSAIRKRRPEDAIHWQLDCGEEWADVIGELPEEVEALAFMSAVEAQQALRMNAAART